MLVHSKYVIGVIFDEPYNFSKLLLHNDIKTNLIECKFKYF